MLDRRRVCLGLLVLFFVVVPIGQALALDPSSAQAYCNAVKKAAADAQKNYLAINTPSEDPQQVFDDSVQACLGNIANFSVPSIDPWVAALDKILQRMAQELMQKACGAAREKIQSIVGQAQQTVDQSTRGVNDIGIEGGLGGLGQSSIPIGVPPLGSDSSGSGRFLNTPSGNPGQ